MAKIGIVASIKEGRVGVNYHYMNFFMQYGDVEIILPWESEIRTDLNLLVLPGGADINPLRYGEYPDIFTGRPDIHMEMFDEVLLEEYIQNRTPIFGICRGLQNLIVHFGGTLVQHVDHEKNKYDRGRLIEEIEVQIEDFEDIKVNSLHHQVAGEVPDCFMVLATSKKHKTVEAIKHTTLPIAAVQWHPEIIHDVLSDLLIKDIIR